MKWVRTKKELATIEEEIELTPCRNGLYRKYVFDENDKLLSCHEELISSKMINQLLSEKGWREIVES